MLRNRIIYILVILVLAFPLSSGFVLPPSRMIAAEKAYEIIDNYQAKEGELVFVAFDFGPGSKAENYAQAEVAVEHLFRKRAKVVFFSLYALAEGFLESLPKQVAAKLAKEHSDQSWTYGVDWINLGFKNGGILFLQALVKSDDLASFLKKDSSGAELKQFSLMKNVGGFSSIKLLVEFSSLSGMLRNYVQYFNSSTHRPLYIYGCTSIGSPEAYIYLDSGQINALYEGIGGAAWYSKLLTDNFVGREADSASLINSAIGVGHLLIIGLVAFGNVLTLFFRAQK
ncbi:MAG TPA: hypothetical protein PKD37_04560 [Oligoflexia bacterium]|nr:hypothetical protein [Oligoflexia bacterium]HMP27236.1 hypothetical protein [Oligoflexia bacterium]